MDTSKMERELSEKIQQAERAAGKEVSLIAIHIAAYRLIDSGLVKTRLEALQSILEWENYFSESKNRTKGV